MIAQILTRLESLGVKLSVQDGELIARPLSVIPPDLRALARQHRQEIIAALRNPETADAEDLTTPQSILEVCDRYGVSLRVGSGRDLVVGRAGAKTEEDTQPWPALVAALEANIESVARLVEAGWHLGATIEKRGE